MDEPRFYIIAWAGRMKYGSADMSKYHLVDTEKDSKLFGKEHITGCGRLSCASAICGPLDYGTSIDDRGEPETLSDLDQITCRACRRSKTFKEVAELLAEGSTQ